MRLKVILCLKKTLIPYTAKSKLNVYTVVTTKLLVIVRFVRVKFFPLELKTYFCI